ncbi:MAG: hypothetical protein J6B06_00925 [Lachnospiraceae bacterium]|nr:hypothetical protein [Lachnospiraceae bacterium]
MEQTIRFTKMKERARQGYVTWGAPWKKGCVTETAGYVLTDEAGTELPVQSAVSAYWPDGSVKWSRHTAKLPEGADIFLLTASEKRGKEKGQLATELEDRFVITGKRVHASVPRTGNHVIEELVTDGRMTATYGCLPLLLEERGEEDGCPVTKQVSYTGIIKEAVLEENGSEKAVICLRGVHRNEKTGRETLPFVLRLSFYDESDKVHITHTFLYDGDDKKDFLKGIGIQLFCPVEGELCNRHVKFATDYGCFHESLKMLLTWRPRIPAEVYEQQMSGKNLNLQAMEEAAAANVIQAMGNMPTWSNYHMCQDSASHFYIRKRTGHEECCYLDCLNGNRAAGAAAVAGEQGGIAVASRDFWQKYPSGIWFDKIDSDCTEVTIWLWTPEAEAMDYRHYDVTGYSQSYYEGFDELGADPYGIANTNELEIMGFSGEILPDEELLSWNEAVQKPMVLVASPQYYHSVGAFGRWSLPNYDTPFARFVEEQLDAAVEFYKEEIDTRGFYGFYNYGDVMHTYDKARHTWRYDMGGFAWQNTELVPTLWLWYAFLRSGREDIFTLAEAMSRHCSEVDTYHLGKYKGIGSRHNVRHWGCPCKEARIGMAGHHRFYYYLTGDGRMADVFDDTKDADFALLNIDPMRFFYDRESMVYPTHARSGPDWSSFCSNWLTEWERHKNTTYRDKIKTGIEDLKQMPLQLISGSDFEYDPADNHLRYIGERSTGGCHLQICMGAAQTWIELSYLLEDEEWSKMLADFGRFYLLPQEKKNEVSGGLFGKRTASFPYMATAMTAFAAEYYEDENLGRWSWHYLVNELLQAGGEKGFADVHCVENTANQKVLKEIPWISTNFTAQWCLNAIMALELIGNYMPQTLEEMKEEGFLKELECPVLVLSDESVS